MEYCDYIEGCCKYLSLRERHQTDKTKDHICMKYGIRILHKEYHPFLPRLEKCIEEDGFEKEVEI